MYRLNNPKLRSVFQRYQIREIETKANKKINELTRTELVSILQSIIDENQKIIDTNNEIIDLLEDPFVSREDMLHSIESSNLINMNMARQATNDELRQLTRQYIAYLRNKESRYWREIDTYTDSLENLDTLVFTNNLKTAKNRLKPSKNTMRNITGALSVRGVEGKTLPQNVLKKVISYTTSTYNTKKTRKARKSRKSRQ